MMKILHNRFLVLGVNKKELEMLTNGKPLMMHLDDLGLKGQSVVIVHGSDNEHLGRIGEDIVDRMMKVDVQNATGLILPDKMN